MGGVAGIVRVVMMGCTMVMGPVMAMGSPMTWSVVRG